MKVGICSLGCKVNIYESELVTNILKNNNYTVVDFEDKADIYIINTCSVTNESDKKSRKMINRAKKNNPAAIIIVMGCYSQVNAEDIDVDIVLGNKDKSKIVEIIEEYIKTKQKKKIIYDLTKVDFEKMEITNFDSHTRAFVKIQDGCNRFCTFCTIPYARGSVCSKDPNKVIAEVKELAANGFKEVILSGIHTASYGLDLEGTVNLLTIIEDIEAIDGIERIRIGSLEPGFFSEENIEKIKSFKKLRPHFHLSLQSGCNTVLKRMNRRYSAEEYKMAVENIRKALPDVSITTDVIVGFPGETEEEFNETYKFLQDIKLTKTHVFKYSPRKGTKAADMPNQIDGKTKDERSKLLIELSNKNEHDFIEKFVGREMDILVEKELKDRPNIFEGYTRNYIKVEIDCMAADITGKIVDIKIEKAEGEYAIVDLM